MESRGRGWIVKLLWKVAALIILVVGMTACSHLPFMGSSKEEKKTVKTLWQSGEQYVAIEKQDSHAGVPVKPNEHVSEISVERLRSALASIDLRAPDKDKSIALFNEDELRILSEHIAEGLALVGPDEDVTFAVIGHYVEAVGFLKKRMVTGGRVFCRDGQINIIFGDIHRVLAETMGVAEDRRLHPFMVGSRVGAEGKHEGILLPKPGGEIFGRMRDDWVLFPVREAEIPGYSSTSQESGVETQPAADNSGTLSPTAPAAASPAAKEYAAPGAAAHTQPPAVNRGRLAPAAKKSPEERLTTLNELFRKKLITDEEYRAKRQEILNEL